MARQLAAVFDLNKCLGCHTCSMACKLLWTNRRGRDYMYWNNVESAPGLGYPKGWGAGENQARKPAPPPLGGGFEKVVLEPGRTDGRIKSRGALRKDGPLPSAEDHYGVPWDFNYETLFQPGPTFECPGAKGVRPQWQGKEYKPRWGVNWEEDQGEGEWPNNFYFYLPRICNQCTKPACVAACERKALYKREEDGVVLVDQKRCRGYRDCVRACPYKKIYFNPSTGTSEKCILCYPRVEKGVPPACFWSCVGKIRSLSARDDKNGPVYKLVEEWKVALPLHPEFGTEPNVFYVPPTSPPLYSVDGKLTAQSRIPIDFLGFLFGGVEPVRRALATVEDEREKVRKGGTSELLQLLIGHRNEDRFQLNVGGVPYKRPEEVQPVRVQFRRPSEDA